MITKFDGLTDDDDDLDIWGFSIGDEELESTVTTVPDEEWKECSGPEYDANL